MKIKVRPEDFIVREETDLSIGRQGAYRVYLLEKRFWNTTDALGFIARRNGLRVSQLGYGGRKDRYALTYQYVTVKDSTLSPDTGNENLRLTLLGSAREPFAPKHITGNRFTITLRQCTVAEAGRIAGRLREIGATGFVNYFGEQRFGSYDRTLGFFGEKFLKAHYNGALKCLLCARHPEDGRDEKERKTLFLERWGDFAACLAAAKTDLERRVFSLLAGKPKAFLNAVHLFPVPEISMNFSAYQSFLWNRICAAVIEQMVDERTEITIKEWPLPVFHRPDPADAASLGGLVLPVPGLKPRFQSDLIERAYDRVLTAEGLHQGRFVMRTYRKVILKSFPRQAVVTPADLSVSEAAPDELYPGHVALTASFVLPRGSFATTLLKQA